MRWLFAVVGLVAGCGRFGFAVIDDGTDAATDAKPCIASGHDEDGDGYDDACDVCPQRADTQIDTDDDGVGDACDLQATQEQRTLFDPFTGRRPEWNYNGIETIVNDVMNVPGVGTSIRERMVAPPARNTWELGGVMLAVGAGSRQLSIQIGPTVGNGRYYCELYDDGATFFLQFTYTFNNNAFMRVASSSIPGRLDAGPVRMTLEHTPPGMRCLATWKGVDYVAQGAIPAGILAEALSVAFNNVDVDLQYFVRLANP